METKIQGILPKEKESTTKRRGEATVVWPTSPPISLLAGLLGPRRRSLANVHRSLAKGLRLSAVISHKNPIASAAVPDRRQRGLASHRGETEEEKKKKRNR